MTESGLIIMNAKPEEGVKNAVFRLFSFRGKYREGQKHMIIRKKRWLC